MNRYTFADLVYSACRLSLYPLNWCALYVVARDCDLFVYNNYRTCWHLTSTWHVAPALRGSQLINGVACNVIHRPTCTWKLPTRIVVAVLHQKLYIMAKYRIPIPISRYFKIPIPNTEPTFKKYRQKYRIPIPTSNTDTDTPLVQIQSASFSGEGRHHIKTLTHHVFVYVFLVHGFDAVLEQFWFLNETDAVV